MLLKSRTLYHRPRVISNCGDLSWPDFAACLATRPEIIDVLKEAIRVEMAYIPPDIIARVTEIFHHWGRHLDDTIVSSKWQGIFFPGTLYLWKWRLEVLIYLVFVKIIGNRYDWLCPCAQSRGPERERTTRTHWEQEIPHEQMLIWWNLGTPTQYVLKWCVNVFCFYFVLLFKRIRR